jgi:hypothetical protein
LQVERSPGGFWQVEDEDLRRAVRLGEADAALLRGLEKGATATDLAPQCNLDRSEVARRLSSLARLYVIGGERARRRLQLQDERFDFAEKCKASAHKDPLEWPLGRDPPQHGCVATGTCCQVTFLGPLTHADRVRVDGLDFPIRRKLALDGQHERDLYEEVDLDGKRYVGMAHEERSGRCLVQRDDLLCDIHATHSLESKPVACRQFPLRFYRSPLGVHVSLILACDGYHRSRSAAQPWTEREGEIRALLHEGASWVKMALPLEWSAGLPAPVAEWPTLRDQLYALEPESPRAAHAWLGAILDAAEAHLAKQAGRLAEGPEIAWTRKFDRYRQALSEPARLYDAGKAEQAARAVDGRAGDLDRRKMASDARRLRAFAGGVRAQVAGLRLRRPGESDERALFAATDDAWRHLADVIANDLQVQVVLGHFDAGLMAMTRRLLLVEALACAAAKAEGRGEVQATDTTHALHIAYRCEPDLGLLAKCEPSP